MSRMCQYYAGHTTLVVEMGESVAYLPLINWAYYVVGEKYESVTCQPVI
jgi:hypothetical protein